MEKLLTSINPEWITFTAHKIANAEVVWMDCENLQKQDSGSIKSYLQLLVKENAYIIKDTPCFSELEIDVDDSKTLTAERYGGVGIGVNGGGGRCGNTEQYQLKGIGANCMIGEHEDEIHKYGGLDAPLAMIETIYTNLFSILLPLGAVKIRGLIYTGKKSAIYHHPANTCWGIIMLRDHCIRPAHFMRAPGFKPQTIYKQALTNDVSRVRNINKRLFTHFKDNNQFILFLGKYLQNCANQFGFARAARIMHGTLSPSNISIDGRWLDLPIASMLSGGINHGLSSNFYNEHTAPLEYAIEILHGYSKYNKTSLNPVPLIKYYNEQFDAYFRHYIGYVLGLNLEHLKSIEDTSWKIITGYFNAAIHAGKHIDDRLIESSDNDPVHALIAALFLSIKNSSEARIYFEIAGITEEKSIELAEHFKNVINQLWKKQPDKGAGNSLQKNNFITITALIALKRAYLSEIFFAPLIAANTWELCQNKTVDDIAPFIESYSELSKWIYTESEETIFLFKSEAITLFYSPSKESYNIKTCNNIYTFSCYSNAYTQLVNTNDYNFEINKFSFLPYFKKLKNILCIIENEELRKGNHE